MKTRNEAMHIHWRPPRRPPSLPGAQAASASAPVILEGAASEAQSWHGSRSRTAARTRMGMAPTVGTSRFASARSSVVTCDPAKEISPNRTHLVTAYGRFSVTAEGEVARPRGIPCVGAVS